LDTHARHANAFILLIRERFDIFSFLNVSDMFVAMTVTK
jgi:hypothetical protein